MEWLQGPINPLYNGEQLDVECYSLGQGFLGSQSLRLELEEVEGVESQLLTSSLLLEDNMPFLQMLQSVELPPFFPLKEPNFQTLLKLQHLKKPCYWDGISPSSLETQVISSPQVPHQTTIEHESCVTTINTHDNMVDHFQSSQVKCENFDLHNQNPPSSSLELEGTNLTNCTQQRIKPSLVASTKERKKRKRARPSKNKEDVESQRMTHIAVERNRRRLMNEHLNSLRSLMPPSYIQRGDQASIIGGAIDFVKELEQLLQSLESQKRMKRTGEEAASFGPINRQRLGNSQDERPFQVRQKSDVGEIEITTTQNHVKLKVQCQKRPSQLLRAIVAFEELRLTVLHLNVTSSQSSVLYTFNLKIEEECELGSADEVAAAVHQIFTIINGSCLAHAS